MVLRIGPAGARPLRLEVGRGAQHSPARDHHRRHDGEATTVRLAVAAGGDGEATTTVRLAMAAGGDDDGRGQEEHGAEQHLHQRIQVGGRHDSSLCFVRLGACTYVRGRRRPRGILECRSSYLALWAVWQLASIRLLVVVVTRC